MANQQEEQTRSIRLTVTDREGDGVPDLRANLLDSTDRSRLNDNKLVTDQDGTCEFECSEEKINKLGTGTETVVVCLLDGQGEVVSEIPSGITPAEDGSLTVEVTLPENFQGAAPDVGSAVEAATPQQPAAAPAEPSSTIGTGKNVHIRIPNLLGRKPDDAEKMLKDWNLGIKTRNEPSHDHKAGIVFRQYPEADAIVEPGSEVVISISEAVEDQTEVPDDFGLRLADPVVDIASYMQTHDTGGVSTRTSGHGTHGDAGALQNVLDGALASVLGRRFDKEDSHAFYDSLSRSFAIEEVDGKREIKLTQRAYAVQTELGGTVTGAAASLYHRGQAALNDALPLLAGLGPLDPDADDQEVEAIRSIIRTEFVELVNEFGLEEGPRLQRVNDTFSLLFGQLNQMEVEAGYSNKFVNTVEEEQNLTNFLVVRDYVSALHATWQTFQEEYTGTKFLGTQLVLLARALSSVGESVNETYQIMDSVYLGPAERQTVRINFPKKVKLNGHMVPILEGGVRPAPLLVEELLSWVSRFARTEGPTLIQDGGRRGVETIGDKAELLQKLVLGAAQTKRVRHIGFSRTRVRRALFELSTQLAQVAELSQELRHEDR